MSLIKAFLLGLYSSRDFGPIFEYYDLEVTQKQISTDIDKLKYHTQLEKIENALMHAQFQILVRKDYGTAEAILAGAKEDLKKLIASLPIEETVEPKQVLSNIERVIRDVQRGPSVLDEKLREISGNLTKMRQQQ